MHLCSRAAWGSAKARRLPRSVYPVPKPDLGTTEMNVPDRDLEELALFIWGVRGGLQQVILREVRYHKIRLVN